jgi:hypothetical protein
VRGNVLATDMSSRHDGQRPSVPGNTLAKQCGQSRFIWPASPSSLGGCPVGGVVVKSVAQLTHDAQRRHAQQMYRRFFAGKGIRYVGVGYDW